MDSPKQKQKTWKIIKLRPKCFAPIIYMRDTIKKYLFKQEETGKFPQET